MSSRESGGAVNAVELIIYTEPVAKARARVVVNNGKAHSFTPVMTTLAESAIRWAILQEYKDIPFPAGMPLKLVAVFYRQRPKSLSKAEKLPVKKPDLDNYLKTLCDAMNGFLVHDDSQIVHIETRKYYGEPPRIEVSLAQAALEAAI